MDTLIFVAFCIFVCLVGMRMRQRWLGWRQEKEGEEVDKNRHPKTEHAGEPPEVRAKRLKREKRIRFFMFVQFFVLGGLMVYMIPTLIRDFMVPGRVDVMNLVLRCLIFVFTIYIFILSYFKLFARKNRKD